MNITLYLIVIVALMVQSMAFTGLGRALARPFTTSLLAGKIDKSVTADKTYWEGDWVCADCGSIYDADIDGGGLPFEEMKRGFSCPQCSAPRKRYAKAVNGKWGVTLDGGDLPIYASTIAGLAFTIWFALIYVPTL